MRVLLSSTARAALLGVAALAAAASSSSSGNQRRTSTSPPEVQPSGAPPATDMNPDMALGLWHSSFGPVKIERDNQRDGEFMGVWVYDRQGQEVVGFFHGPLEGNVMNFFWEEPADPEPLRGRGYLVFDPDGRNFHGKWWTDNRDRGGDWNGWRERPTVGRGGTSGAASTPRGARSGSGGGADAAPPEETTPPPAGADGGPAPEPPPPPPSR